MTITADYDAATGVLYLALGRPEPAEGELGNDGLLYRYAINGDRPCGVTVLDVGQWIGRRNALASRVSEFLHIPADAVERALIASQALTASTHR